MSSVNIADELAEGYFFTVSIFFPTGFAVAATGTSLDFYLTSDIGWAAVPSNCYVFGGITTQYDGSAIADGWNDFRISALAYSKTGSPDPTAIQGLSVHFNWTDSGTGAYAGFCLDDFAIRKSAEYELRYYTKNIIVPATGANKQYFTADDDSTLMSSDGEMAFIEYATMFIAPNLKDFSNVEVFTRRAMQALANFKRRYPSERRKTMKNYYFGNSFD
jgi:hypothetical protein